MGLKPQDVVRINSRRLPLRVLQAALTAKDVTTAKLKALFGARRRKPKPVAAGISKLERRMLKHQARTQKWLARFGENAAVARAARAAELRDRFHGTNAELRARRRERLQLRVGNDYLALQRTLPGWPNDDEERAA